MYRTGFKVVASGKDASVDGFNPLSRAWNTVHAPAVKITVQMAGVMDCEVCPAVQFSDDGVSWDDAEALDWQMSGGEPSDVYVEGTTEWSYGDVWVDLDADVTTTSRRLCRFGVIARGVSATNVVKTASINLHVDVRATRGRVLAPEAALVASYSSVEKFSVLTEALPAGQFRSVRASWELMSNSEHLKIQGGMQVSDDGVTWEAATRIRSANAWKSALGWEYGTVFQNRLDEDRFVRFGILADAASGAQSEMGYARLIVEGRES